MHTDEDYVTDAYPAALEDIAEAIHKARFSPSLGEGDEEAVLLTIATLIDAYLSVKDPPSAKIFRDRG